MSSETRTPEPAPSPLGAMEQILRGLMRELGEARFALEQTRREARDQKRQHLSELLSAIDAFDRVLAEMARKSSDAGSAEQHWLQNLRTVRALFDRVLQDANLLRITPDPSEAFDPHWHRVSATAQAPDRAEGAILEVSAPGWLWEGTLLRKAAVIVVQNGETRSD